MAVRVIAAAVRVQVGSTDLLVERGGLLPEKVDADTIKRLVRKGMVEKIDSPEAEAPEVAESADDGDNQLSGMNLDELRQFAAEHDIDLGGATRKADVVAAIESAQA